jgi:hypothetical protein
MLATDEATLLANNDQQPELMPSTKSKCEIRCFKADLDQTFLEYDNQQMKLLLAIYLPPHIVDDSELKVEFAEGIDSELVLWMPRGPLVCVKATLRNEHLQSPITAHQLELENLMYYKYSEHLLDPFSIELAPTVMLTKFLQSQWLTLATQSLFCLSS